MAPLLGAISVQMGRKMPLLIVTTLIAVAATLMLGTGGLLTSLVLFATALCSMELGTIFYNALLSEVSTPANRVGMVSGLGKGIGYLGSFIAVGAAFLCHRAGGLHLRHSRGRPSVPAICPPYLLSSLGAADTGAVINDSG